MKQTSNKWKITAIIFIILFVVQLFLGLSIILLGVQMNNKEIMCEQTCEGREDCFAAYYNVDLNRCEYISYEDLEDVENFLTS